MYGLLMHVHTACGGIPRLMDVHAMGLMDVHAQCIRLLQVQVEMGLMAEAGLLDPLDDAVVEAKVNNRQPYPHLLHICTTPIPCRRRRYSKCNYVNIHIEHSQHIYYPVHLHAGC